MKPATAAVIILLAAPALGAWNPEGWEKRIAEPDRGPTAPGEVAANILLSLYRNGIGPTQTSRCPSHPSCSTYALEAVKTHGAAKGLVLTASRLVSEADEGLFAPRINIGGQMKVDYPVENPFILAEKPHGP